MSALAGFLGPAAAADADRLVRLLADALAARGPDGLAIERSPAATMIFRPFCTTPRSVRRQPYVGPDGVLVCWDGRLDNGEELALDGDGDAEVVANAYHRWGVGFVERLVGDFAVAVWEPRRRRLILARDALGSRPLFYLQDRRQRFLWASNLSALRAAADTGDRLDEEWIAGYLAQLTPTDRSPWRGIHALPPAHLMVVEPGRRPRPQRYWPGEIAALDGTEADHEERFLAALTTAVRRRLSVPGTVFAELSGGFDSSSIVCLADGLLRRRAVPADGLETCSYVYDPASGGDESEFIRAVEERTGRTGHHISDRETPLLVGFERSAGEAPTAFQTHRLRHLALAERMRSSGARVLLTGVGGDDIGISQVELPPLPADLAVRRRMSALRRELGAWQRTLDEPYPALLWRGVVHPLLPRSLARRLAPRRLRCRIAWVVPSFARRSGLSRRRLDILPGPAERHLELPSQRWRCANLRAAVAQQVCPRYLDVELTGWENCYPFLDRQLVELAIALPAEVLVRPGETRRLHRRALAGVLPEAIARRTDKRGPTGAMMQALDREWERLQQVFAGDALLYQAGIVERAAFLAALDRARSGLLHREGPLVRALEIEGWLRGVERAAPLAATA